MSPIHEEEVPDDATNITMQDIVAESYLQELDQDDPAVQQVLVDYFANRWRDAIGHAQDLIASNLLPLPQPMSNSNVRRPAKRAMTFHNNLFK